MAVNPIPDGYHSVTPSLVVDGAERLIQFMGTVFGAKERMRMPMPDGKVAHAEIELGDSVIMVADAGDQWPASTASLHLYVQNSDATFGKALDAGATVVQDIQTMFYGDRAGTVQDAFGNRWTISQHVEDVPQDEMMKRMAAMAPA